MSVISRDKSIKTLFPNRFFSHLLNNEIQFEKGSKWTISILLPPYPFNHNQNPFGVVDFFTLNFFLDGNLSSPFAESKFIGHATTPTVKKNSEMKNWISIIYNDHPSLTLWPSFPKSQPHLHPNQMNYKRKGNGDVGCPRLIEISETKEWAE